MTRFDVVVVGAGQAGIEAALAAAGMGLATACVTLRLDRIGHLPCNCSIGGPGKGHLVREVDALGGQMARTTDRALTHIRRVGTGKGPAVQTLRAHVCKDLYPQLMESALKSRPNLTLLEGSVERVEGSSSVTGVWVTPAGSSEQVFLDARAVVLTTGTFLNGRCHQGQISTSSARRGDAAVSGLSNYLQSIGVRLGRFKTGTTPRIDPGTVNWDVLTVLSSDASARPFSFASDELEPANDLMDCWQTRTNEAAHEIIRQNLHQSAVYGGQIEGIGPRYCPSIEDKVVRFADKSSHPVFLEIETWNRSSVYVQGTSTSLPAEVQLDFLRALPGMESVEILVPGYAVEYDMADPQQLHPSLMSKLVPGLFLAGQINGTSGYEEAASQGILAGINAALWAKNEPLMRLPRENSYIGVMVDDLTTLGVDDPYRMLTARSEHRLTLRHDNADARLTPLGRELGLIDEDRWARYSERQERIASGIEELRSHSVTAANDLVLASHGHVPVSNRTSFLELLQRPEVDLTSLEALALELGNALHLTDRIEERESIELQGKYVGYLKIAERRLRKDRKLDALTIPADFRYESIRALSHESREKLGRVRPSTVGQASRVSGVRPTDIAILAGFLKKG